MGTAEGIVIVVCRGSLRERGRKLRLRVERLLEWEDVTDAVVRIIWVHKDELRIEGVLFIRWDDSSRLFELTLFFLLPSTEDD